MRSITIAGNTITDDSEAWVIAELGHNHGGSVECATELIVAAAAAGADAAKLQRRDNRNLYTKAMYDRPYTSENAFGPTYGSHREALELKDADYLQLREVGRLTGITVFATAFDVASAEALLRTTDAHAFKIASGDLTNTPLLREVAGLGRPMIVSTGAADQVDVDRAVNTIWPLNQQLALLQCTAVYPAPPELLNLRCITTYRERYPEVTIGLSSHYSGISDVVGAYILGARIFEKHFTADRTLKGTDHAFSLEPAGFAKMVSYLRKAKVMLGSARKVIDDAERPALDKMGKQLVFARALGKGHTIGREDLVAKSPGGNGFQPWEVDLILGCALLEPVEADRPVLGTMFVRTGRA